MDLTDHPALSPRASGHGVSWGRETKPGPSRCCKASSLPCFSSSVGLDYYDGTKSINILCPHVFMEYVYCILLQYMYIIHVCSCIWHFSSCFDICGGGNGGNVTKAHQDQSPPGSCQSRPIFEWSSHPSQCSIQGSSRCTSSSCKKVIDHWIMNKI